MSDKYVLHHNVVYKVEAESTAMYKVSKYGVSYHLGRWVDIEHCVTITKEVADCMVACDPPQEKVYENRWIDPRGVFNAN